jgi:hypothetical protein
MAMKRHLEDNKIERQELYKNYGVGLCILRCFGEYHCLEIDERAPGFQLLTQKEIAAVIFFIDFHEHYLYY